MPRAPRPRIYLDANATAPTWPEVRAAVESTLAGPINASSVHAEGRRARAALERARARVAETVGARPEDVIFTSGGTEANNLVLKGRDRALVVSAIEHPSVLECAPVGVQAPVTASGVVDLVALGRLVGETKPGLVSLMYANNETGVVQPVAEASRLVHAAGALLHVDAVQALGKLPIGLTDLGADLLTVSAHKIGGPPGVGAVVSRPGVSIEALLRGGGQERRHRAGTENLPGIAGFAAALDAIESVDWERVTAMRARLEGAVGGGESFVAGADAPRLPGTSSIVSHGLRGDLQVMALDLAGFAVSSGAACSSGKVGPSHVLAAMGLSREDAACAIRVSLGWWTTEADIDAFVAAFREMRSRIRERRSIAA